MTKLFDDGKIMIDFDKILCFYIKEIFPIEKSFVGLGPYSNLIIIIGNKIGEPKEITFRYSHDFMIKDKWETRYNYIGKQIHDELLNYFKNDN